MGRILVFVIIGIVYVWNQVHSVYGGDAGDLLSAIAVHGVAHPPGYPLYTTLGIFVARIVPFHSLAWRVGFLSSIPAVLTLVFLFDILRSFGKGTLVSLISVSALAFAYLYWLFAEVVEVFQLNNLFMVVLLWCAFSWKRTREARYIFISSFIAGLALAHQHIILFLFPSLIYLFMRTKPSLPLRAVLYCCILFLTGFSFYFYPWISSLSNPALNWMGTPTFENLGRLMTRQQYGMFQAGGFIVHEPLLRLLNVWAFVTYFFNDFRILGMILALIGLFSWTKVKDTIIRNTLGISFFSYLFFLYYASFPLVEDFMVGTFERFLLPLYVIATVFIAFGIDAFVLGVRAVASRFFPQGTRYASLVPIVFILYPAGLFLLNYPRISPLGRDLTAEHLGEDILSTVASDGILIISSDTPLFDTQYVYYTQKKWNNMKLIHFTKLFNKNYQLQLKKEYPDLHVPPESVNPAVTLEGFLQENYDSFPIYSKLVFTSTNGVWVPDGLLFRYYRRGDEPTVPEVIQENERVWPTYRDPLQGSLSRFQHLILSDVVRVYALSHQEYAYYLAREGYNEKALYHLNEAVRLDETDADTYTILAQVFIQMKQCDQAKKQIEILARIHPQVKEALLLLALNAEKCQKDPGAASSFYDLYEKEKHGRETRLDSL